MAKDKFLVFSYCCLLCCLVLVAILASCQRNLDGKGFRIDISQNTPHALEKLFTSARVVPLETTDSSLIARIDKIVLHEEKIYILDTRQYIVFVFDCGGHFLFKIDQRGRGPEEYRNLYDMNINPCSREIELLDAMGYLLTFDFTGQLGYDYDPVKAVFPT